MTMKPSLETVQSATSPNKPSALTTLLDTTAVPKNPQTALSIQVLHNLQHQHSWTDLKLHTSRPSGSSSPATSSPSDTPRRSLSPAREPLTISSTGLVPLAVPVISGRPPKPLYIHPEIQAYMIRNDINEADVPIEVEWVLPTSIGEKWSLRRFAEVFDSLPEREALEWVQLDERLGTHLNRQATRDAGVANGGKVLTNGDSEYKKEYRDAKRVVLAMLAHAGMGGDGTLSYYIMQEGDVKPRQN